MSLVTYPAASPYLETPQLSWRIQNYVNRSVPVLSTDVAVMITPEFQYRPDKFSYSRYNSPAYWWILMLRNINVLRDPIWDFRTGLTIMVPLSPVAT